MSKWQIKSHTFTITALHNFYNTEKMTGIFLKSLTK